MAFSVGVASKGGVTATLVLCLTVYLCEARQLQQTSGSTAGQASVLLNLVTQPWQACSPNKLICSVGPTLVAPGQNLTYQFVVPPNRTEDLVVYLTSNLLGNADLTVAPATSSQGMASNSTLRSSNYTTGDEVVIVNNVDLSEGPYTITVSGVAPGPSNFSLSARLGTDIRVLNTQEMAAFQQIYNQCCIYSDACLTLKASFARLGTTNVCEVTPNYCSGGHLRWLNLASQNLQCSFPFSVLQNFTQLQRLELQNNSITEDMRYIMPYPAVNSTLTYIDFSSNHLGGNLSCELMQPGTEYINLDNNELQGSIGGCFMNSSSLVELHLSGNALSGALPPLAPGPLTTLTAASQVGGGLMGPVPSLGGLSQLQVVDLSGNALTGPLPPLPPGILRLNLANNSLSGAIPAAYGSLVHLEELDLGGNALTGPLPWGLAASPQLQRLAAPDNQLNGTLPNRWQALQLAALLLANNSLTGPLPADLAVLPKLTSLDVSHNALNGTLDDYCQQLPASAPTTSLILNNNQLSGSIPPSLAQLGAFTAGNTTHAMLDLSNNSFSGAFPTWLIQNLTLPTAAATLVIVQGVQLECPFADIVVSHPLPTWQTAQMSCLQVGNNFKVSAKSPALNIACFIDDKADSGWFNWSRVVLIGFISAAVLAIAVVTVWWYCALHWSGDRRRDAAPPPWPLMPDLEDPRTLRQRYERKEREGAAAAKAKQLAPPYTAELQHKIKALQSQDSSSPTAEKAAVQQALAGQERPAIVTIPKPGRGFGLFSAKQAAPALVASKSIKLVASSSSGPLPPPSLPESPAFGGAGFRSLPQSPAFGDRGGKIPAVLGSDGSGSHTGPAAGPSAPPNQDLD